MRDIARLPDPHCMLPPPPPPNTTRELLRDLLGFQIKLALDAARELVMIPLTLAAAALDLLLAKSQPPRYFHQMQRWGDRCEEWINTFVRRYDSYAPKRADIDALLGGVERLVRDPRAGAHRARVLARWASRNLSPGPQSPASPELPPTPPPPPGAAE
jgi:hypothetical protein